MKGRENSGFTLIEAIVVLCVLGLLAGMLTPLARSFLLAQRLEKVKEELNQIGRGLNTYWLDNAAFPAALTTSAFLNKHLYFTSDHDAVYDDLSPTNAIYSYSTSGTPTVATLGSVGIDGISGTSDDISLSVTSERAGRILTRKKLKDIARAMVEYINAKKYVSTTDAWALSSISTDFQLSTYYDTDGWGNAWIIHATKYRIYSKGPDGTDDSGGTAGTGYIGDDDITF